MIMIAFALWFAFHFYSQRLQIPEVLINTPAVRGDLIFPQLGYDLRHGDIMLVVCPLVLIGLIAWVMFASKEYPGESLLLPPL